jgi:hypothetical protein
MTRARDIAVGTIVDTSSFLTATSNLDAAKLTTGTIPNARYGTPTFSAANLTSLPSGGKVVQVIETSTLGETNTGTYTTAINTNLSASISPTSATNKLLVFVNQSIWKNNTNVNSMCTVRLEKGNTVVKTFGDNIGNNGANQKEQTHIGGTYFADAGSTSQLTFKTTMQSSDGASFIADHQATGASNTKGSIVIMEIAA